MSDRPTTTTADAQDEQGSPPLDAERAAQQWALDAYPPGPQIPGLPRQRSDTQREQYRQVGEYGFVAGAEWAGTELVALRARVEELTALVETTRGDGAKLAEAGYFEGWWAAYNSPDPHKRKPSDDYADSDTRKAITILTTTKGTP